jgi:hypothetical protein
VGKKNEGIMEANNSNGPHRKIKENRKKEEEKEEAKGMDGMIPSWTSEFFQKRARKVEHRPQPRKRESKECVRKANQRAYIGH